MTDLVEAAPPVDTGNGTDIAGEVLEEAAGQAGDGRHRKKDRGKRIRAHKWVRHPQDWYVEPSRATGQLLAVESFSGTSYDPACGQGNIVNAFLFAGRPCYGTDIRDRVTPVSGTTPAWFKGTYDFLAPLGLDPTGNPRQDTPSLAGLLDDPFWPLGGTIVDNIVMNPPFFRGKGAEAFIRRALRIAQRKVAAFVETRFLGSEARAGGFYLEHPPTSIWMVTPRPSCPPGDYLAAGNKAEGGRQDCCWIVWDKTTNERQPIRWLTQDHVGMPALGHASPKQTDLARSLAGTADQARDADRDVAQNVGMDAV